MRVEGENRHLIGFVDSDGSATPKNRVRETDGALRGVSFCPVRVGSIVCRANVSATVLCFQRLVVVVVVVVVVVDVELHTSSEIEVDHSKSHFRFPDAKSKSIPRTETKPIDPILQRGYFRPEHQKQIKFDPYT